MSTKQGTGIARRHGHVYSLVCMVLAAVAFGGCADDPVVPPATSTLAGRVEDTAGNPIAGVVVLVGDKPPVTSDAQGAFQVDGVGATYRATLLRENTVYVYESLSRRDPIFRMWVPTGSYAATVTGTVPPAADKRTLVFFETDDLGSVRANPTSGAFSLPVYWSGPSASIAGTLYVLRETIGADDLPSQYDAFASRDLALSHGATVGSQNFTTADFSDPPEAKVSGSIGIPSGYELNSISTYLVLRGGECAILGEIRISNPSTSFEYTVPIVPDATFKIETYAFVGENHTIMHQSGIVAPATGIRFDLPPAPQIIQPVRNASDVGYQTLLQWTEGGGTGVYAVFVRAGSSHPEYSFWLNETSTTIPDLTVLGISLPNATTYNWIVNKVFPLSSMDDVIGPEPWGQVVGPLSGYAHSEYYSFTTQP